jgi:hypothetical protein
MRNSLPYSHGDDKKAKLYFKGEISGSHGGEYGDDSRLCIAPYNLTEVGRRFRGAYCRVRCIHRPDDGGSTHLWNVGLLQQGYTVLLYIKGSQLVAFRCDLCGPRTLCMRQAIGREVCLPGNRK